MKPVIIQVPSSKDGKVTLTVKELQDMLDKAYESGKQDGTTHYGYCPYKPWYYSYGNDNTTTPLDTPPHITWTSTNTSTDTISGNNICSGPTNCCS